MGAYWPPEEEDPVYVVGGATDVELAAAVATLNAAIAAKQDASTAATDAELAALDAAVDAAVAALQAQIDALPTDAEVDADIAAQIAAHAAGDATDAELAAAVASLTASIALKQDAATAATDTELADAVADLEALLAAHEAGDASDAELTAAVDSLTTLIAAKQDAATAATDAELAAAEARSVALNPATSVRNVIIPTGDIRPLTVRARDATDASDLLRGENSAGSAAELRFGFGGLGEKAAEDAGLAADASASRSLVLSQRGSGGGGGHMGVRSADGLYQVFMDPAPGPNTGPHHVFLVGELDPSEYWYSETVHKKDITTHLFFEGVEHYAADREYYYFGTVFEDLGVGGLDDVYTWVVDRATGRMLFNVAPDAVPATSGFVAQIEKRAEAASVVVERIIAEVAQTANLYEFRENDLDLMTWVAADGSVHANAGFFVGANAAVLTNDVRLSDQRAPTDGSVTAAKVAAALKPSGSAAAGDESLRALGTSGSTAAAGDDSRFPSSGEKSALVGTQGTPGSSNKYVTDADPRIAGARAEAMWLPTGAKAQTYDRRGVPASGTTLASGTLQLAGGMVIPAGTAIASMTFLSGSTPLASGTSQSFYIINAATREILARTVDDGSTAWAANAPKTLLIDGSYTAASDIAVWMAILVVATTVPNIQGASLGTAHGNLTPLLGGRSNSGLTGRLSVGATINAPSARAEQAYAYVS